MTGVFIVAEEVRAGLDHGAAVVALETSVIGQGLPAPRNLECVERMDAAIRVAGAIPAWIGVVDGAAVVGLNPAQLDRIAESGASAKVARRDLPLAVAGGVLGATTVSATIWAAHEAGIPVSATGGIGGVHLGEEPDVSADLLELARTQGLLVCSGPKSIVDPAATAERLDELGVVLIGYGVGRLPFFLCRETDVELEHRVDTPDAAAAMLTAARALGTRSTLVLCNPVPGEDAMDERIVRDAAAQAELRAEREGIHGKDRTPFLLAAMAEITDGTSLEANLALLEDNARVAGLVAAALSAARSG